MEISHTWPRCPQADAFFTQQMASFLTVNPPVAHIAARLGEQAGVSILKLVDHWLLPASDTLENELRACGLTETTVYGEPVWEHTQASFTDLPMLKQAFTQPETWPVASDRLQVLLDAGSITHAQADKFRDQGAPGSHLEILQRWDGFKGFNKTGVSSSIRATDARNQM